jgi:O-antigen ligase
MSNSTLINKINLYSLYILAFAIPFHKKIIPPLIILFLISSLINGNYKLKNRNKNILFFTSLYVLYLLGLLYTQNLKYGFHDLETKLSLLIFPLAFYISKINFRAILNNVLKWFVFSIVISSIICLGEAIYQFIVTGDESELFYYKLSLFHHTSYISMYLNLGVIICYHFLFKQKPLLIFNKNFTLPIISFLTIMIVMFSAKTGIITMLLAHAFFIAYWTIKTKSYFKALIVISLIAISFFSIYKLSHTLNARVNEAINTLTSNNKSNSSTTAVRIDAWKTSLELISTKPVIGYGTGDTKDELLKKYNEKGLLFLVEKELNPHNQFLQTTLSIGLIGLLIFIATLVLPAYYTIKKKENLYFYFILLFSISILTESMLETISGVVFYTFFNALFFAAYFTTNKTSLT